MDGYRIAVDQLPYATPPFTYEFISTRKTEKWRIHDAKDNAVGSANTEAGAIAGCVKLNTDYPA